MKPHAVVINVGRGATIQEQALFEACRDRRIGGAIIDTWYSYPAQKDDPGVVHRPSRFPFHELDNVVMTPHASAWTDALLERRCRVIAGNLDRLARGEPLVNLVRAPERAVAAA
jgi:phosphoglycerate dehydrogenase-like enzyme